MKMQHLLYGIILLALASTGCKKTYFDNNKLNIDQGNGGGKTTPNGPVLSAQLKNFKINGASCAYDSTQNTFYYPVAAGTELSTFTVSFDTITTKSIYLDDKRVFNGNNVSFTLKADQEIVVKAVNSLNLVTNYHMMITGLPMVSIYTNTSIGDERVIGTFNLVNPNYKAQQTELEISVGTSVSIRGATSRFYPKKSYSVHLVDGGGNDIDKSLLGLRNDNNWILDAAYVDQSRMRNRMATDIWNSFNNVPYAASEPEALNGTRGYMTEVFVNYKYMGVYCLTEKLDRKQLKIKKQYGNMYKANDWTNETDFYGLSPFNNASATWGGWELEYPELGDTPAPNWGYLYNVVNFISTATDAEFSSQIKDKVEINNIVDYFIFMNISRATDNQNKNTFFSFYDSRVANKFFYSVWDLEGSFGGSAAGGRVPNTIIGYGNNNMFARLIKLNPGDFKGLVKTRWEELKANQLSKSKINEHVEKNRSVLGATKAFSRERTTWGNIPQDLNSEANYIKDWYSAQFVLMDDYINNL
ncbi:CotH kinase family protein [Mucilaginibacter antarcticus]|uniref:CotH kinase family protein n=1 Tax=Mucilaginibacter antarcticus TaxID=1855725 RepID=A0ABW5XTC0_9SPHI